MVEDDTRATLPHVGTWQLVVEAQGNSPHRKGICRRVSVDWRATSDYDVGHSNDPHRPSSIKTKTGVAQTSEGLDAVTWVCRQSVFLSNVQNPSLCGENVCYAIPVPEHFNLFQVLINCCIYTKISVKNNGAVNQSTNITDDIRNTGNKTKLVVESLRRSPFDKNNN